MTFRFGKRLVALGALVTGLTVGGSSSYADLTLNISQAGGPAIAIDATLGNATLTGEAANTTYIFAIDNQAVTFHTDGSGNASATFTPIGPGGPSNSSVSFVANGTDVGLLHLSTAFGDYTVNTINATETQTVIPNRARLNDVTSNVSNASSGTAAALTVNAGYESFTSPTGLVKLQSILTGSTLDAGLATFTSTLNGTTTPSISFTPGMVGVSSAQVTVPASTGPAPYLLTNSLVISGLGFHNGADLTATSNVLATPEPATLASALLALPMVAFALRRRKTAA